MVDRILRMKEIAALLGVTKPHIYTLIRAGDFPKGISLGVRAHGWRESEVNAWIAARPAPAPALYGRHAPKAPASVLASADLA